MSSNSNKISRFLEELVGDSLDEERADIKDKQEKITKDFVEAGTDPVVAKCRAWAIMFDSFVL